MPLRYIHDPTETELLRHEDFELGAIPAHEVLGAFADLCKDLQRTMPGLTLSQTVVSLLGRIRAAQEKSEQRRRKR